MPYDGRRLNAINLISFTLYECLVSESKVSQMNLLVKVLKNGQGPIDTTFL